MNEHLDERDRQILGEKEAAFNAQPGPRVGDFIYLADGTLRRLTHDWGEMGFQTTCHNHEHANDGGYRPRYMASFYLADGYAEFSGGLDPIIDREHIRPTVDTFYGQFWFFHHRHRRAHNGVTVEIPCRVFREHVPEAEPA